MSIAKKYLCTVVLLGFISFGFQGCAELYHDSVAGMLERAVIQNRKEANSEWRGTAILKRDIYPNGTVVFTIDHNKIPEEYRKYLGYTDYTDKFIDEENYNDPTVDGFASGIYTITYSLLKNSNRTENHFNAPTQQPRVTIQPQTSNEIEYQTLHITNLDTKKVIHVKSFYYDFVMESVKNHTFPEKGYMITIEKDGKFQSKVHVTHDPKTGETRHNLLESIYLEEEKRAKANANKK